MSKIKKCYVQYFIVFSVREYGYTTPVPGTDVQLLISTMHCVQLMKVKGFNWSLSAAVHATQVKWSMIQAPPLKISSMKFQRKLYAQADDKRRG